jgi:HlyD family secretion protein
MTPEPSVADQVNGQPESIAAVGSATPAPVAKGQFASRPIPKSPHLPTARRRSKALWWIGSIGAGAALVVIFGIWYFWFRGPQAQAGLETAIVGYKDLQLKVVERGTLEARENHDIKCEVKTGSRGAPKIKSVVENGTYVKKGDLLVEIDDSYLQEQALAKKIDRLNAESDKVAAEQTYPQKLIAISLADKTLEKWIKGDYPQTLHDLEGQIQTAESAVLQQEDRTSWAARMVKKKYMTASQEEAERATLIGDKLSLQKLEEQKKVLLEYTDPVNRQTYDNAIKQAKVDERTAYAKMESARAVFQQQDALYNDLLDQIKQCKIYAEHDGIVVYAVPEQTRMGAGSTQSIIAQGEPVQYGQKLMSIPDLEHMMVNVRIHEVFINHIKSDNLKEGRNGLPATIRVDALPGKILKGHVHMVASVAAPQDWMSPDVKVYQAYVAIDDDIKMAKLKPGLSAVCTVFTDEKAEHVLSVPVQAVVSPLEKNGKPRCFVLADKRRAEPREVELGMSDNLYVEIKSGLSEGEEVVLNPQALLNEKERKGNKPDEKVVPTGNKASAPGGSGGKGKGKGSSGGEDAPSNGR